MKKVLHIIFFVMILGSFLTTMLLVVDLITAPKIKQNEKTKLWRSVLAASGIELTSKDTLEKTFTENVNEVKSGEIVEYRTKDGGIAFEFNGSGLWGPIKGIIALEPDLETVKRIIVIHQEETPGLGSRIGEEEFLKQFNQLRIKPQIKIITNRKAAEKNEVDGITGATLSCNAFEQILNKSLENFFSHRQGL